MIATALSPNVSVCGQIAPADVTEARDHGFRSIICIRPDGEEAGQPEWPQMAAAADQAGLDSAYIPVPSGNVDAANVATFAHALEALPKPILAYCRTGARSTILWALANNGSLTAEERIRTGRRAGFDLEPWRDQMDTD